MERPRAGVRSGYVICTAHYKNENMELLAQKAGRKGVMKILNSKAFFLPL